jgi:hypothetical protein
MLWYKILYLVIQLPLINGVFPLIMGKKLKSHLFLRGEGKVVVCNSSLLTAGMVLNVKYVNLVSQFQKYTFEFFIILEQSFYKLAKSIY